MNYLNIHTGKHNGCLKCTELIIFSDLLVKTGLDDVPTNDAFGSGGVLNLNADHVPYGR